MTASNVFDLEDVIAYCKCPLMQRYRSWGAETKVVDAREAIRIASRDAIRMYMGHGMDSRPSPAMALDRAVRTYKSTLLAYDRQGLFNNDFKFSIHFNFGLVMIRRFHEQLNHNYDRPLMGPKSCTYQVGEDVILGDIDGFICFNVESREDMRFGVVTVSQRPKERSVAERVREGFNYAAFRALTKDLRSTPIEMINVDPWARKIERYPISVEDKHSFEVLAAAAVRGIKNQVYMPQPVKVNCRTCPYDTACKIKYAAPGDRPWHKTEFLKRLKH